jgi:hypothetical protein
MPAAPLHAQFTDQELTLRTQARAEARRALPDPAATARALALAICEQDYQAFADAIRSGRPQALEGV